MTVCVNYVSAFVGRLMRRHVQGMGTSGGRVIAMQISSIRLGFACNSSSSHSILLKCTMPERAPETTYYGCDWFHLRSRDDKARYLAATLYGQLPGTLSARARIGVVYELLGVKLTSAEGEEPEVDHNSEITLPCKFGEQYFDEDFLSELNAYIVDNPDVTILGGNTDQDEDEGEDVPEFDGTKILTNLPRDRYQPLVCRKDGDWWVLFNRSTGGKVRLSFACNPASHRALTPELVDVKITDYCPHGCRFCYQMSTLHGLHAKHDDVIKSLTYEFERARVFEVALGGGETTAHPQFSDILHGFSLRGVTPNFTSYDMSWSMHDDLREAVIECAGGFAVSRIDDHKTLCRLKEWNDKHYSDGPCGTLNIPLGCYSEYEVRNAIMFCRENYVEFTLLGFKSTGRGHTFETFEYCRIMDVLKDSEIDRFGADTRFVEQFHDALVESGVSEKLIVGREGSHSCYIDAVRGLVGPSSFCDESEYTKLDVDRPFGMFPYA